MLYTFHFVIFNVLVFAYALTHKIFIRAAWSGVVSWVGLHIDNGAQRVGVTLDHPYGSHDGTCVCVCRSCFACLKPTCSTALQACACSSHVHVQTTRQHIFVNICHMHGVKFEICFTFPGTVKGHQYFTCADKHGVLCGPQHVTVEERQRSGSLGKKGRPRSGHGTFGGLWKLGLGKKPASTESMEVPTAKGVSKLDRKRSSGKKEKKLVDELLKLGHVNKGSWGNVATASKSVWLGSGLLAEVNPTFQMLHAKETADGIIRSCVDGTKAIIVVSDDHVGAIDSKNRALVLVKDGVSSVQRILQFDDKGFVAYTTQDALMHFRHVHVFSLKRPAEMTNLVAQLEHVAPATLRADVEQPDSNVAGSSASSGVKVLPSRYLGSAMVSERGWWQRNAHVLEFFGDSLQRTTDELFEAASMVLCKKLEGRHDEDPSGMLRDDVGVLVSSDNIQVLDALTHQAHTEFMPIQVTDVRVMDVPVHSRRRVAVNQPESPGKHVLPVNSRMTQAERLNFMTQVRDGKMTVEDAVEKVVEVEQVEERIICILREDTQHAAMHIEVLLCTSSPKNAEHMRSTLEHVADQAIKRRDDPFCPKTDEIKPSPTDFLAAHELDRDKLTAVELVGHGEFGEVFLANQSVRADSLNPDDPARNNAAADNDGEVEVQRAVKTVGPKVGKRGITEFTAEAAIQLRLKHKHIAELVGVCMTQPPFLVVLEYIMYGDLKKVLTTCREKEIMIRPSEQFYFIEQIADALAYITSKKIVHLDLAARNCLIHAKSNLKIADFGLAREYDSPKKAGRREGFNLVGKMKIPFLWCPPECLPRSMWNKAIKTYNPIFNEQSDVWAFGVVCWEIASYGVQPYGSASKLLALLQKIDDGMRLEWPAGCHPKLKEYGERCFALEPDERPHFPELKDELLRLLEPMKSKIRDVGNLLNAPLEERLREMSTRATLIRRKSISLLKSEGGAFTPQRQRLGSDLETDLETVGEDDEEPPLLFNVDDDDYDDDGAGTPSLSSRPNSVIDLSNPSSSFRETTTLSRRNSFARLTDMEMSPAGKPRRASTRIRRKSSKSVTPQRQDSVGVAGTESAGSAVDHDDVAQPRKRTASTHSDRVVFEDGGGGGDTLSTPPDLGISRKLSGEFHSSDSESDSEHRIDVPKTVPEDEVADLPTVAGGDTDAARKRMQKKDSFDDLGGLLGAFASLTDEATIDESADASPSKGRRRRRTSARRSSSVKSDAAKAPAADFKPTLVVGLESDDDVADDYDNSEYMSSAQKTITLQTSKEKANAVGPLSRAPTLEILEDIPNEETSYLSSSLPPPQEGGAADGVAPPPTLADSVSDVAAAISSAGVNLAKEAVPAPHSAEKKVPPLVAAKKVPPPVAAKSKTVNSLKKALPPPVSPRVKKKVIPEMPSTSTEADVVLSLDADGPAPRGESNTDDLAFLIDDLDTAPITPSKTGTARSQLATEAEGWSVEDVEEYLKSNNLASCATLLKGHGVDGKSFISLDARSLLGFGIDNVETRGHLMRLIRQLRIEDAHGSPDSPSGVSVVTPPHHHNPIRDGRTSVKKRREKRMNRLAGALDWDIDEEKGGHPEKEAEA